MLDNTESVDAMAATVRQFDTEAEKPSYQPLPAEVVEAIRRHLAEEHGLPLNQRRDISWRGNRVRNPVISVELTSFAHSARFWCEHCPGKLFPVGEPDWGPERVSYLSRTDPAVEPLLRGLPADRRIPILKLYESGELQRRGIDAALARERQRTRQPGDPASVRRREGAQQWMLDRYAEVGNRVEVWDELEAIIANDAERWYEISRGSRKIVRTTIERYWKDIPIEDRDDARARYLDRPERERRAELAARRRAKLTP